MLSNPNQTAVILDEIVVGQKGRALNAEFVPAARTRAAEVEGNQRKAAREQIFDSASHLPDPSRNGMRTQESRVRS